MYRYGHQEQPFDHNLYIHKYLCQVFHLFYTSTSPPLYIFCGYISTLIYVKNQPTFHTFYKFLPFALFFDITFGKFHQQNYMIFQKIFLLTHSITCFHLYNAIVVLNLHLKNNFLQKIPLY